MTSTTQMKEIRNQAWLTSLGPDSQFNQKNTHTLPLHSMLHYKRANWSLQMFGDCNTVIL